MRGESLGAFVPLATFLWRYGSLQLPIISLRSIRVFTILFRLLWHCLPLANSPLLKDSPVALFAGNTSFQLEPQMIQEVGRLGGNRAPTNAHNMVVPMPGGGRQPGKVARAWTWKTDLLESEFSPQISLPV